MSFKSALINTVLHFIKPAVPAEDDYVKDGLILKAALISDTHICDDFDTSVPLTKALRNISGAKIKYDVLAITGDCTNRGRQKQLDVFSYILYSSDGIKNILPVMGNHDTGLGKDNTDGYEANKNRFMKMLRLFAETDKPYYFAEINGVKFIALAPESDIYEDNMFISDEQIAWFRDEIKTASQNGNPVFVLCHYALNHTHHIDVIWPEGELGERSDEIKDILNSASGVPVFYITGHIHNYYDVSGVSKYENFYLADLPSFCGRCIYFDESDKDMKTQLRRDEKGLGYQLLVYNNRAVFRAVNFITNKRYPQFDKEIIFGE